MVHLIVGYGEVGKSLGKVLGKHDWIDFNIKHNSEFITPRVIHICIPYSKKFNKYVKQYQSIIPDSLVIVHSSVPIGTCDKLGVVHSPIAGVHPHLEEGIRTFVKYFGGTNKADVRRAANIFSRLGIRTKTFKNAKTTEAMKLWSTTQYGRMLMLEKEIYEWCEKNEVDFNDVYTRSNIDYNEGYTKLGMENVVRPYYKHVPGPIGGHCVLPNAKLLGVKI